jgi:Domain of unknown function (DUF4193)
MRARKSRRDVFETRIGLVASFRKEYPVTIDYDIVRTTDTDEISDDLLADIAKRHGGTATAVDDIDEADSGESIDLPGADIFAEELSVLVIPKQANEFTCSSCFLVLHRSRLANRAGQPICTDCAD